MTTQLPIQPTTWQLCEHCQSPLDAGQRYCVVCGAHSAAADDPAARYLASATRHARGVGTPVLRPARSNQTAVLAVLLALLPLAAGVGVLVGRGQSDPDRAILDALKAQRPPVVNVGAAGTATTADTATGGDDAAKQAHTPKKTHGKRLADGGEVLATGPAGSARKLEGSTVTKKQLQDSAAAVKRINDSKGKAYVESQRNLPDQIVIP